MRSKNVINKAISAAAKAERRNRKKAKAGFDRLEAAEIKLATPVPEPEPSHVLTIFATGNKFIENAERTISHQRARSVDDSIASYLDIDAHPRRVRRNTGDAWDALSQQHRRQVFQNTESEFPITRTAQIWSYMYSFDAKATDSAAAVIHDGSTGDLLHISGPISSTCDDETFHLLNLIESLHEASPIDTPELSSPFHNIDEISTDIDESTASILDFIRSLDEVIAVLESSGNEPQISEVLKGSDFLFEMAKPTKRHQRSRSAVFQNHSEKPSTHSRGKTGDSWDSFPPWIKTDILASNELESAATTRSAKLWSFINEFDLVYCQAGKDSGEESAFDTLMVKMNETNENVEKSKSLPDFMSLNEAPTTIEESEKCDTMDAIPNIPEVTFALTKDDLAIDTELGLEICSPPQPLDLLSSPSETVVTLAEETTSGTVSPKTWSLKEVESFLRLDQPAKSNDVTFEIASCSGLSITLEELMRPPHSPTSYISLTPTLLNVPTGLLETPLAINVEDLMHNAKVLQDEPSSPRADSEVSSATPELTNSTVSSPTISHHDHCGLSLSVADLFQSSASLQSSTPPSPSPSPSPETNTDSSSQFDFSPPTPSREDHVGESMSVKTLLEPTTKTRSSSSISFPPPLKAALCQATATTLNVTSKDLYPHHHAGLSISVANLFAAILSTRTSEQEAATSDPSISTNTKPADTPATKESPEVLTAKISEIQSSSLSQSTSRPSILDQLRSSGNPKPQESTWSFLNPFGRVFATRETNQGRDGDGMAASFVSRMVGRFFAGIGMAF
ncbi:hypothetical protein HDU97_005238 [Phlyctochytrium planicorne]|nr:hypothetical protein HDU97_005238 [Phlyctochytrium planicorne]